MYYMHSTKFVAYHVQCRWFTGTSSRSIWQVVWCQCRRLDCSPAHTISNASRNL